MKFTLTLVFITFIVFGNCYNIPMEIAEDWLKGINTVKLECLKEFNMSPTDVVVMYTTWDIPHSFKCYMRCTYLKLKLVNEGGDFINDELLKYKGLSSENVEICEKLVESTNDLCDKVLLFARCIVENISKS